MLELNNRNVAYGYDNDYRLTSEAITADPAALEQFPRVRLRRDRAGADQRRQCVQMKIRVPAA